MNRTLRRGVLGALFGMVMLGLIGSPLSLAGEKPVCKDLHKEYKVYQKKLIKAHQSRLKVDKQVKAALKARQKLEKQKKDCAESGKASTVVTEGGIVKETGAINLGNLNKPPCPSKAKITAAKKKHDKAKLELKKLDKKIKELTKKLKAITKKGVQNGCKFATGPKG